LTEHHSPFPIQSKLGRIGAEAQAIVRAVVGKAHRVSFAAGCMPGPSSIATDHSVVAEARRAQVPAGPLRCGWPCRALLGGGTPLHRLVSQNLLLYCPPLQ